MGTQDLDEQYPRKFGKYHLLGPLAQGGMGALYLAVTGERGLERLLVIKTILPHLADAEYIARFRDEAKVVIKLSHGNLIPVFDAGQVGGELFLAMDFVEGRDLRAVWNRCAKKQVAFPIDVAVYLVKELCRGLAYAHSLPDLDLVHRDVSPPNILVSYTGEVKLTDFGLASSTLKLEKTAPGIIYGKVAYMSPEQARGERLDGRSDMYAAGIVLWELLTGRQLFPPGKDQPADLVTRAKNPEVMRPSRRAPRVPPELDEICVRALAPERDERYASCDEMRQALQTWLAQHSPTMDAGRISTFLQELFAEDIARERAERAEMLNRLWRGAMSRPPTDELRQMIERSSKLPLGEPADVPVRSPNSVGRRATDFGKTGHDRRQNPDRRFSGPMARAESQGSAALARAQDPEVSPESEVDLTGTVIDGRYRIDELIGEGGMGKVYLAEHIEIGKRVAVKVLHPSYSRMPELVERFRREARAASKIGHPNIVDVTDSGTTAGGSVYFVMEYLEGVELGSVIERDRAMDVARALRIVTQICRALSAAHSVGVIHRDLKPENVFLVTRDNTTDFVKVLDFGIAKTAEAEAHKQRLTSPGMAMGTPEYMAPEQAAGKPADARCDVYSLGAILYEMLTGDPPYRGDNFMEILTKKATLDPVPPHELRPELPEAVSRLVLQAMSRNPDFRPASMSDFEYELNKCLSGRGAAVAQALGMTDPNLVAGLAPSLSGRTLEDGLPSRASGPLPMMSGPSQGGMSMPSPMALPSGAMMHPGPSRPLTVPPPAQLAPDPNLAIGAVALPTATAMPRSPWPADSMASGGFATGGTRTSHGRGGASVFGWVLLIALVAGAGAVAYVLVREPTQPGQAAAAAKPAEPVLAMPPGDKPVNPASVTNTPGTAGVGTSRPVASGGDRPSAGRRGNDEPSVKELARRADKAWRGRQWSKVIDEYGDLLAEPKWQDEIGFGEVHYRVARSLFETKQYQKAEKELRPLISGSGQGGNLVDINLLWADLCRQRGDSDEAHKHYVRALNNVRRYQYAGSEYTKIVTRLVGRIQEANFKRGSKDKDAGIDPQFLSDLNK